MIIQTGQNCAHVKKAELQNDDLIGSQDLREGNMGITAPAKVTFSSVFSVCLSDCLPVNNNSKKTGEPIFMKYSGLVGHSTKNNLDHFGDYI